MHPSPRLPQPRGESAPAPVHQRLVIVVGDSGLTLRFVKNLTGPFGFQVRVLMPEGPGGQRSEIAREAKGDNRVKVIRYSDLTVETFRRAGLEEAYAVALMNQDDVGNLHLALQVRQFSDYLNDDTPPRLIIRMYNKDLGTRIQNLLGGDGVHVESDADMVARTYASAALGEIPPGDIDVWERTLYLTRRPDEQADHQWVVANDYRTGVEIIPDQPGDSTLRMLCLRPPGRRQRLRPVWDWLTRRSRQAGHAVWTTLKRKWGLVIAAFGLFATMAVCAGILLTFQSRVNPVDGLADAAYLVALLIGGGIDPEMGAHRFLQVTHAVLVLSGSLLVPVVTGAVVQVVVDRRYALSEGRMVRAVRDHVIVVGLGNMGTRVVEELRRRKIPVVAIEKERNVPGIHAAREAGAQILIGDASRPETLHEAEIKRCRALVAMAKQDSANLETALAGIELREDLRTVMRIYNPEFAALVRQNLNKGIEPGTASQHASYSAPQVAAGSFARALTEDGVLMTVPVRGQNAYLAEVEVGAGSALDDASAEAATAIGSHRLLAVKKGPELKSVRWHPAASFVIRAGDRLLVLASRSGLDSIMGRCRRGS